MVKFTIALLALTTSLGAYKPDCLGRTLQPWPRPGNPDAARIMAAYADVPVAAKAVAMER